MSGYASALLTKIAGKFVSGLTPDNIDISVFGGHVSASNLTFLPSILDAVDAPLCLKYGRLGKLRVELPWSSFLSTLIRVEIEDLFVVIGPNDEKERFWDSSKYQQEALDAKRDRLAMADLMRDTVSTAQERMTAQVQKQSGGSAQEEEGEGKDKDKEKGESALKNLIKGLFGTLLNGVSIHVKNVHFRYEDDTLMPKNPFAVGVVLESLSTADLLPEALASGVDGMLEKSMSVSGLGAYFDLHAEMWVKGDTDADSKESKESKESQDSSTLVYTRMKGGIPATSSLFLLPLAASLAISFFTSTPRGLIPKFGVSFMLDKLSVECTKKQFVTVLKWCDWLRGYLCRLDYKVLRHLRPRFKPSRKRGNARTWWAYAMACVMEDVSRKRFRYSKEYIHKRREDRITYVRLYTAFKESGDEKMPTELQALEDRLEVEDVLYFRAFALSAYTKTHGKTWENARMEKKGKFGKFGKFQSAGRSSLLSLQAKGAGVVQRCTSYVSSAWKRLWGKGADTVETVKKNDDFDSVSLLAEDQQRLLIESLRDVRESNANKSQKQKQKGGKAPLGSEVIEFALSVHTNLLSVTLKDLGHLSVTGIHFLLHKRVVGLAIGGYIGDIVLQDVSTTDTLYPFLLKRRENKHSGDLEKTKTKTKTKTKKQANQKNQKTQTWGGQQSPAVHMMIDIDPPGQQTDILLKGSAEPLDIVLNVPFVVRVVDFFLNNRSSTMDDIKEAAWETWCQFQEMTTAQLEDAILSHTMVGFDISFVAPRVVVPMSLSLGEHCPIVVADLGQGYFCSSVPDKERGDARYDSHCIQVSEIGLYMGYSYEFVRNFENLKNAQGKLDPKGKRQGMTSMGEENTDDFQNFQNFENFENFENASLGDSSNYLAIIPPTKMKLVLQHCVVPSKPAPPAVRFFLQVQKLVMAFDQIAMRDFFEITKNCVDAMNDDVDVDKPVVTQVYAPHVPVVDARKALLWDRQRVRVEFSGAIDDLVLHFLRDQQTAASMFSLHVQHTALALAVRSADIGISVGIKNCYLIDHMQKNGDACRVMVQPERALEANEDLVKVVFTMLKPESPLWDGVEQVIDVQVQNLAFMLNRMSLFQLLLFMRGISPRDPRELVLLYQGAHARSKGHSHTKSHSKSHSHSHSKSHSKSHSHSHSKSHSHSHSKSHSHSHTKAHSNSRTHTRSQATEVRELTLDENQRVCKVDGVATDHVRMRICVRVDSVSTTLHASGRPFGRFLIADVMVDVDMFPQRMNVVGMGNEFLFTNLEESSAIRDVFTCPRNTQDAFLLFRYATFCENEVDYPGHTVLTKIRLQRPRFLFDQEFFADLVVYSRDTLAMLANQANQEVGVGGIGGIQGGGVGADVKTADQVGGQSADQGEPSPEQSTHWCVEVVDLVVIFPNRVNLAFHLNPLISKGDCDCICLLLGRCRIRNNADARATPTMKGSLMGLGLCRQLMSRLVGTGVGDGAMWICQNVDARYKMVRSESESESESESTTHIQVGRVVLDADDQGVATLLFCVMEELDEYNLVTAKKLPLDPDHDPDNPAEPKPNVEGNAVSVELVNTVSVSVEYMSLCILRSVLLFKSEKVPSAHSFSTSEKKEVPTQTSAIPLFLLELTELGYKSVGQDLEFWIKDADLRDCYTSGMVGHSSDSPWSIFSVPQDFDNKNVLNVTMKAKRAPESPKSRCVDVMLSGCTLMLFPEPCMLCLEVLQTPFTHLNEFHESEKQVSMLLKAIRLVKDMHAEGVDGGDGVNGKMSNETGSSAVHIKTKNDEWERMKQMSSAYDSFVASRKEGLYAYDEGDDMYGIGHELLEAAFDGVGLSSDYAKRMVSRCAKTLEMVEQYAVQDTEFPAQMQISVNIGPFTCLLPMEPAQKSTKEALGNEFAVGLAVKSCVADLWLCGRDLTSKEMYGRLKAHGEISMKGSMEVQGMEVVRLEPYAQGERGVASTSDFSDSHYFTHPHYSDEFRRGYTIEYWTKCGKIALLEPFSVRVVFQETVHAPVSDVVLRGFAVDGELKQNKGHKHKHKFPCQQRRLFSVCVGKLRFLMSEWDMVACRALLTKWTMAGDKKALEERCFVYVEQEILKRKANHQTSESTESTESTDSTSSLNVNANATATNPLNFGGPEHSSFVDRHRNAAPVSYMWAKAADSMQPRPRLGSIVEEAVLHADAGLGKASIDVEKVRSATHLKNDPERTGAALRAAQGKSRAEGLLARGKTIQDVRNLVMSGEEQLLAGAQDGSTRSSHTLSGSSRKASFASSSSLSASTREKLNSLKWSLGGSQQESQSFGPRVLPGGPTVDEYVVFFPMRAQLDSVNVQESIIEESRFKGGVLKEQPSVLGDLVKVEEEPESGLRKTPLSSQAFTLGKTSLSSQAFATSDPGSLPRRRRRRTVFARDLDQCDMSAHEAQLLSVAKTTQGILEKESSAGHLVDESDPRSRAQSQSSSWDDLSDLYVYKGKSMDLDSALEEFDSELGSNVNLLKPRKRRRTRLDNLPRLKQREREWSFRVSETQAMLRKVEEQEKLERGPELVLVCAASLSPIKVTLVDDMENELVPAAELRIHDNTVIRFCQKQDPKEVMLVTVPLVVSAYWYNPLVSSFEAVVEPWSLVCVYKKRMVENTAQCNVVSAKPLYLVLTQKSIEALSSFITNWTSNQGLHADVEEEEWSGERSAHGENSAHGESVRGKVDVHVGRHDTGQPSHIHAETRTKRALAARVPSSVFTNFLRLGHDEAVAKAKNKLAEKSSISMQSLLRVATYHGKGVSREMHVVNELGRDVFYEVNRDKLVNLTKNTTELSELSKLSKNSDESVPHAKWSVCHSGSKERIHCKGYSVPNLYGKNRRDYVDALLGEVYLCFRLCGDVPGFVNRAFEHEMDIPVHHAGLVAIPLRPVDPTQSLIAIVQVRVDRVNANKSQVVIRSNIEFDNDTNMDFRVRLGRKETKQMSKSDKHYEAQSDLESKSKSKSKTKTSPRVFPGGGERQSVVLKFARFESKSLPIDFTGRQMTVTFCPVSDSGVVLHDWAKELSKDDFAHDVRELAGKKSESTANRVTKRRHLVCCNPLKDSGESPIYVMVHVMTRMVLSHDGMSLHRDTKVMIREPLLFINRLACGIRMGISQESSSGSCHSNSGGNKQYTEETFELGTVEDHSTYRFGQSHPVRIWIEIDGYHRSKTRKLSLQPKGLGLFSRVQKTLVVEKIQKNSVADSVAKGENVAWNARYLELYGENILGIVVTVSELKNGTTGVVFSVPFALLNYTGLDLHFVNRAFLGRDTESTPRAEEKERHKHKEKRVEKHKDKEKRVEKHKDKEKRVEKRKDKEKHVEKYKHEAKHKEDMDKRTSHRYDDAKNGRPDSEDPILWYKDPYSIESRLRTFPIHWNFCTRKGKWARKLLKFNCEASEYSAYFSLDNVGATTVVTLAENLKAAAFDHDTEKTHALCREYVFSVTTTVNNPPFHITKLTTIAPRFVLVNQTKLKLLYRQVGVRHHFALPPGKALPFHWQDKHREHLLSFSFVGEWRWTAGFSLGKVRNLALKVQNIRTSAFYFVSVRVVLDGATFHVVVNSSEVPPYRIENATPFDIEFRQTGTQNLPLCLGSAEAIPYAWDDPEGERRLDIEIPSAKFHKAYKLDKLKSYSSVRIAEDVFSKADERRERQASFVEGLHLERRGGLGVHEGLGGDGRGGGDLPKYASEKDMSNLVGASSTMNVLAGVKFLDRPHSFVGGFPGPGGPGQDVQDVQDVQGDAENLEHRGMRDRRSSSFAGVGSVDKKAEGWPLRKVDAGLHALGGMAKKKWEQVPQTVQNTVDRAESRLRGLTKKQKASSRPWLKARVFARGFTRVLCIVVIYDDDEKKRADKESVKVVEEMVEHEKDSKEDKRAHKDRDSHKSAKGGSHKSAQDDSLSAEGGSHKGAEGGSHKSAQDVSHKGAEGGSHKSAQDDSLTLSRTDISNGLFVMSCCLRQVGISLVGESPPFELLYGGLADVMLCSETRGPESCIEIKIQDFQVDDCAYDSESAVVMARTVLPHHTIGAKEAFAPPFLHCALLKSSEYESIEYVRYASIAIQEFELRVSAKMLSHVLYLSGLSEITDFYQQLENMRKETIAIVRNRLGNKSIGFSLRDELIECRKVLKGSARIRTEAHVTTRDANLDALMLREYFLQDSVFPMTSEAMRDTKRVYLKWLHLNPLKLNVTFQSESESMQSVLMVLMASQSQFTRSASNLLMTIANFDRTPIKINGISIENEMIAPGDLGTMVSNHVGSAVLGQVHAMVGNVDLIGAPVSLVKSFSRGGKDFFYDPANGFVLGPKEFIKGLGKGTLSLARNAAEGFTNSIAKSSGAAGKGIALLSFDPQYIENHDREMNETAKNAAVGAARGLLGLGKGVVKGIGGFFAEPVRGGMQERSIAGVGKGLGRGALGVVVKPLVGVADFLSKTAEGARNAVSMNRQVRTRLRYPRAIQSSLELMLYSESAAYGQYLLYSCKKNRYFYAMDFYIMHVINRQYVEVVEEKRETGTKEKEREREKEREKHKEKHHGHLFSRKKEKGEDEVVYVLSTNRILCFRTMAHIYDWQISVKHICAVDFVQQGVLLTTDGKKGKKTVTLVVDDLHDRKKLGKGLSQRVDSYLTHHAG